MKKSLCLLCSGVLLFTACGQDNLRTGGNGEFVYELNDNPKSLDPQLATDENSICVLKNLYRGLFHLDENGNPVGDLAESWSVSDNQLSYTITLRNDCYWNVTNDKDILTEEKTPVTASDFVYAFRRIYNRIYDSPYQETFSCLENANAIMKNKMDYTMIGVYAHSDTVLEFRLSSPNSEFLNLLSLTASYPCNETFFENTKGRYGLDQKSVLGNGPFYLTLWFYDAYGSHNEMYLKRSDHFYESVLPSLVTMRIRNQEDESETLLREGTLDCIISNHYSWSEENKLQTEKKYTATLGLIFGKKNPYYQNQNLQNAMRFAISKEKISDTSDSKTAYGLIPPDCSLLGKSYREMVSNRSLEDFYNETKAKEALQQALTELDVEKIPSVSLLVKSGEMDCALLNQYLYQWEQVLGIRIEIEELAEQEYTRRMQAEEYDLALYEIKSEYNSLFSFWKRIAEDEVLSQNLKNDIENGLNKTVTLNLMNESLKEYRSLESLFLEKGAFLPLFYKANYLVYNTNTADFGFDAYSNSVEFSKAKEYN